MKTYAAIVYLKIQTSNGAYVRFVTSKTRVSPLERQSIPRLELLSALLLARLIVSVENALKSVMTLEASACWTDSKVSLYWIMQLEKEWKQFVQNRVNEIRKLTAVTSRNHCPGSDNPADVPSRGMMPSNLINCELWNHGPEWLTIENKPEKHQENSSEDIPTECTQEMKRND